MLVLFAFLLSVMFLLPTQSRALLQSLGNPFAQLVAIPLGIFAALDRNLGEMWNGYVALHRVHEENRRLQREVEHLQGQNAALREAAAAGQRLAALLEFRERPGPKTLAAQVVGRDATNWYRAIVLNKGERDGVHVEMGVVTPAGVVGRVTKTTPVTSMVLLITDPNSAVAGIIQRARDEGIVEGTVPGRARMKYIPLLSTVQVGDTVVTSGLTGVFPRGLAIGRITRIEKAEEELFQNAEIVPAVDFLKLEEVLVVTQPLPLREAGGPAGPSSAEPSAKRSP